MLSEPFAAVLRSGRETFNARFAHARRARPALGDGARFAAFLRDAADPVVAAVPGSATTAVGEAAYEIGLELVAARGDGPAMIDGWRRVLPAAAPAVAANPRRVLAAVSNVLSTLTATPGARPAEWTDTMARLAPEISGAGEVETFRRLAQVAAWRAGLAHYRASALAVADSLPESLARAVVGAADDGAPWAETRARLARDPWWLPGEDPGLNQKIRLVAQAGGFRGFGGLFPEPPRVTAVNAATGAAADSGFLVRSGGEAGCWLLTADAFGATFHRARAAEFEAAAAVHPPPVGLRWREGVLTWEGESLTLPIPGELTSAAADGEGTTLALTASLTHTVLLIALPPRARR